MGIHHQYRRPDQTHKWPVATLTYLSARRRHSHVETDSVGDFEFFPDLANGSSLEHRGETLTNLAGIPGNAHAFAGGRLLLIPDSASVVDSVPLPSAAAIERSFYEADNRAATPDE
jgi:hypothetical protein